MLKTRKSITLNGASEIVLDDAGTKTDVVIMSANIAESGNSNINTNIVDKVVYEAHKEECRADIDAFTDMVRAIEDEEE